MMALRDTLVYDSENWSTYQPFPVVSLFLCLGPNFIEAVISLLKVYWHGRFLSKTIRGSGLGLTF